MFLGVSAKCTYTFFFPVVLLVHVDNAVLLSVFPPTVSIPRSANPTSQWKKYYYIHVVSSYLSGHAGCAVFPRSTKDTVLPVVLETAYILSHRAVIDRLGIWLVGRSRGRCPPWPVVFEDGYCGAAAASHLVVTTARFVAVGDETCGRCLLDAHAFCMSYNKTTIRGWRFAEAAPPGYQPSFSNAVMVQVLVCDLELSE